MGIENEGINYHTDFAPDSSFLTMLLKAKAAISCKIGFSTAAKIFLLHFI